MIISHIDPIVQKNLNGIEDRMIKEIPLTRKKVAVINKNDFQLVNQFKWHASAYGYAVSDQRYKLGKYLFMHRLIMNAKEDEEVDHINGDKLDNRKSNLRICTRTEQLRNTKKRSDSTNKFKGIVKRPNRNKPWHARIKVNKKEISLGYYVTQEEAAKAYDQAAIKYFGKFARINFI